MRVALTSIGMISSVGRGAVRTCASIRSGLSRPAEIDYYEAVDLETQVTAPLVAYPIRGFTEGFLLMARWLRMGLAAFQDLIRVGRLPDTSEFWAQTGLCVVLPPGRSERFDTADDPVDTLGDAFLERFLPLTGVSFHPHAVEALMLGSAGTALAVSRAAEYLKTRQVQRIVLLAVDSMLDPLTLDWLQATGRLKTDTNPIGLRPGEAAAAVLLEDPGSLRQRQGRPLAFIGGAAVGEEAGSWKDLPPNQGRELARVWADALAQSGAPTPFSGDIVADLNGEPWRAYEYGCAQMRLNRILAADVAWAMPAQSIGDVGAAIGVVGICTAIQAHRRGYAHGPHTVVLCCAESGFVGALCVVAADTENGGKTR